MPRARAASPPIRTARFTRHILFHQVMERSVTVTGLLAQQLSATQAQAHRAATRTRPPPARCGRFANYGSSLVVRPDQAALVQAHSASFADGKETDVPQPGILFQLQ